MKEDGTIMWCATLHNKPQPLIIWCWVKVCDPPLTGTCDSVVDITIQVNQCSSEKEINHVHAIHLREQPLKTGVAEEHMLRQHSQFQLEFEKNFYESQLIVLDTLERCLSGQPKETSRYDEAMNVKSLLRELCQFIDVPSENHMVVQLKNLASKVLFSLSLNNFNAVFSRISARMQELSNSNEENPDFIDIELIQHINWDVNRLIKLLN
ncbi:neurofibromin-like, partial [Stegodyphus dumicola]|uniref:neurofibromin-like n=1 Tax=Stegodyphus dumicola TaxID=202533 RepID=UPI0015AD051F